MKYEIAGVTYNVEEVNGLADTEHFGYINFADSVIRIDANLSEDRKRQTLAHELAHALLYEAGFEDHDEELASRIGRVLHMFLRDNDFSYFNAVIHSEIPSSLFEEAQQLRQKLREIEEEA